MTAAAGRGISAARHSSSPDGGTDAAIDDDFLRAQTFGDVELRRELLGLFVAQLRRLVPNLPRLGPREQADTAHLLKGSARGIGAWAAADVTAAYEAASPEERTVLFPSLEGAFARVEAMIAADDPRRDA